MLRCGPALVESVGDGGWVRTPHFLVHRSGENLTVRHGFTAGELNDDLTGLIVAELDDTGILRGRDEFELVFTGVVRSTVSGATAAWATFYRNSLRRLEHGVAKFAPVHAHAHELVAGPRVIDLGSCFGFFPLRLAATGFNVTATDLSAPTMRLLDRVSGALGIPVRTIDCDAADVPLPDMAADTVTALHLIEHLDPDATEAVLHEALGLARRRVIVAVPFEDEPRACYGHIQRFDLPTLARLGEKVTAAHPGVRANVHEFHGGWLVFER
ncbi:mycofactocin oligosaccharide methyltransferase MftM [Aldersonia kunmingensis]|uniref:mycofactocin oligosaccharide methyltransferase MftM n=1 Tax=Aldersonia kunmingensis TaxID=408066 RepID=UPI000ABFB07F|nr:mycofactocin oligosaccharide methyltransferase MftM [Aldersonia kunmingensis]